MRRAVRNSLRAAAAAALLMATIGWADAASADPVGLQPVGDTSASTSATKSQSTTCPAGTKITGGGGYLTASPAVQGFVALDRLEPLDSGAGFTSNMREIVSTGSTWPLTTKGHCVPPPPSWDVKPETGVLSQEYVTADCEGLDVIGMGGKINGGGGLVILDQVVPSFDLSSVTVRGVPIAGTSPPAWSVTAYAVCATGVPGLERVWFSASSSGASHVSAVKSCPAGKALYSAGADIVGGNGAVALTGVNLAPTDTARAWSDDIAGGGLANWSMTVYGICGS